MNSTFEQNLAFIKESIEEIVKPEEMGAYIYDAQRLYRARKFGWIKALITQMQEHLKKHGAITDLHKCQTLVYLAINDLRLIRQLKKFNDFEFFHWEKNSIKSLYAIATHKETKSNNVASKIITALQENIVYRQEPKTLKTLLEELAGSAKSMGLLEAESTFRASAEQL